MKKEVRTIVYDEELHIEAYYFQGTEKPFPNHFHEHYVFGLMENGRRRLSCRNRQYIMGKDQMLLLNPGDNHGCTQADDAAMDYRGLNISKTVMLDLAEEITGKRELPGFSENVIGDKTAVWYLRNLHQMIMNEENAFGKEENLWLLLSFLMENYGQPFEKCIPECREEIERACDFIENHYSERIELNQICHYTGLSKSTLLRAFTKSKGVTPYRYLEAFRVNKAKQLLEKGVSTVEAAMSTGFSDQSHFTNYFTRFIGLAPGAYREIFVPRRESGMRMGKKTGGGKKHGA